MEIKIIKATTVNVNVEECSEYITDAVSAEVERGINDYLYDVITSAGCDVDDINDATLNIIEKEIVEKIIENLRETYDIVL